MPVGQRHALHDRQRVGALDLGERGGALGALPGVVDLLLRRGERLRAVEPRADGLDAVAAQDIEPVDVLARLAGQSDADLETLMVREGEGARCLLAGLDSRDRRLAGPRPGRLRS